MRAFWFYRLKGKVRFDIALSEALGLSEESRQLDQEQIFYFI
jgi:hypothetical protein